MRQKETPSMMISQKDRPDIISRRSLRMMRVTQGEQALKHILTEGLPFLALTRQKPDTYFLSLLEKL
jgi:hypothetical protein